MSKRTTVALTRSSVLRGICLSVVVSCLFAGSAMAQGTTDGPPKRIRVGAEVQAARKIDHVPPVYPPEARRKGIEGTVQLLALVGTEGQVKELSVLEGPELLADAALEAVWQWTYRVTRLNGLPVEVETQIAVEFSLR